jgi:hypothetical protein
VGELWTRASPEADHRADHGGRTGPSRAPPARGLGDPESARGSLRSSISSASLYGDVDGWYEQDQRERVADLLDRLSNGYLVRSIWLESSPRKRIEDFIERSEDLYSRFCAEINE